MRAALLAMSVLVPLTMAAPEAAAQVAEDRAAKCVLPNIVRGAIQVALNANLGPLNGGRAGSNLAVDVIVIHSVNNENEGQPLNGGGFTGPIVCSFAGPLPIGVPYQIRNTTADTPVNNIDLLASEIQTQVQYRRRSDGKKEKQLCLTTKTNNDCFRIVPPGTP
jgi:hypothetical protein